jgi:putative transcriptional regulator
MKTDDLVKKALAELGVDPKEFPDGEQLLARLAESVQPVAPSADARARLMAALTAEIPPAWAKMADRLAEFFGLPTARVEAIFRRAATESAWEPAMPGMSLFHLTAGPKWAHCDAGLVRFVAGASFPLHKHLGEEYSLIVEGSLRLNDGTVMRPGDINHQPAGSQHSFEVLDEGVIYALLLETGIEIDGKRITADDTSGLV